MNDTLAEARARVQAERTVGIVCPCCDRFLKVYRWRLINRFQRILVQLYRSARRGEASLHYTALSGREGRSPSWLRFWDLAEQPDPRSGHWRITPQGMAFVEGRVRVPRYVYVLTKTVIDQSAELVSLADIWEGEPFDLDEMLAPVTLP